MPCLRQRRTKRGAEGISRHESRFTAGVQAPVATEADAGCLIEQE